MSLTKRYIYNAFIIKLKKKKISVKFINILNKQFRIQCISHFWIRVFLEEQNILKKRIFSGNKTTQIN